MPTENINRVLKATLISSIEEIVKLEDTLKADDEADRRKEGEKLCQEKEMLAQQGCSKQLVKNQ